MPDSGTRTRSEEELKQEIFNLVKEYYQLKHAKKVFEPGKSRVNYAGFVFDENEMVALTNEALKFWITLSSKGFEFEKRLAEYHGVKYSTLVNSGSSALLCAFSALRSTFLPKEGLPRLQPGDEIIVPAVTFPTSVNPVIQNGFVPVFMDADIDTTSINADDLEKAYSPKVKAVLALHSLGNPPEMDKVVEFARKHDLYLIEDNCDGLGGTYGGKKLGTFGHMATYSFFPAHQISMGEGGAVICNQSWLKRSLDSFRDWGRDCWCEPGEKDPLGTCHARFDYKVGEVPYDHKFIYGNLGYNLKPTDLQAAIGVEQLKKVDSFVAARRKNAKALTQALSKYDPSPY